MPGFRESKIEDFAFDYLQHYYTLQQGAKNVVVSKASKTKHGTEIDGVFAFKDEENAVFVAALSFKNNARLACLLSSYKKNGLSKTRYITLLVVLATSFVVIYPNNDWFYSWVLPFIIAIAGYYLHSLLEKSILKRRVRLLLRSVQQHHANEKWLGISISSLCFRNNSLADYCLRYCERKGIGLITVGKRSKVVLMQEPNTFVCRRGDYLSYYTFESVIRKALENKNILRVA